jgi:hypothetical protein
MALWDEPTEIHDDTVFGKRLNDKALQKMPDATGGSMTLMNPRYGLLNARNRGGVRPTLPNRDPENDRPGPDDRRLPSDFIADVDEERNRFSPYQPVAPFGPPSIVDAREWDYPTGYNLEIVNRHIVLGEMLRGIVRGSGIIANELSARVDELVSLPWKFVLKTPAKGVKSEEDPRIKELNAFFKMPDRKIPYPQWMEMIFRERYTIDAATVYIWKNRAGTKPYALEVIDGNTIVPKIDDRGRIPDWPSLAYVQIIKSVPMDNFTEREIVYMPRHRWAQNPIWGYSEVEQILMEATQQVRKTMYMLNFWNEGTCPDVMVCCPENWTAEQIALWQGTFDALMSGNLKLKSKMRFIPGGGKPFEMKGSAGDLLKSEYDEWMARIVCRAFRTDPKPYIKDPQPKANAEEFSQQMRAQGLNGEMLWWSAFMERLVYLGWGWDDIGHAFDTNEETAATDQATIDTSHLADGMRTVNELRARDGLDDVEGGDVPMVKTGTGWMPLAVLAAQKAMPQPAMGGSGGESGPGKPSAQQSGKSASVKKEAGTEADRPLAKRGSHWSRY